ncbi:hypothetical protein [Desulfobaculum bizertense]|uniref:Uncharacterized protein n=1 Tax=Desulfobaculum bizertense DSM 18034 TaxID=1121442 RepID=A0A1T4W1D2_9BACT|nr:hypothetical protein [Desulfobaculum bizertense]UIJ38911.1 hypothetical protein LWC08_04885 [Desulfobaculum bizertense]SKA71066.1 hypothetical protein SAMN02745702_01405 [Desulfobaculum bizertense DSM 18034]
MIHGETLHSALPWDLPLWAPDHVVFFGALYLVIGILGLAVGYAAVKAYIDTVADPKPNEQ